MTLLRELSRREPRTTLTILGITNRERVTDERVAA